VVLSFFGGLTHAELAERLGEPLGTVKSRVRMGLSKLRGLLEEPVQ
jgi:RNA polymerase sigma-70 factor (ECF subfamily)